MVDHLHCALLRDFDILNSDDSVAGIKFAKKLFFLDQFLLNTAENAAVLKIFFTWNFISDFIFKKKKECTLEINLFCEKAEVYIIKSCNICITYAIICKYVHND